MIIAVLLTCNIKSTISHTQRIRSYQQSRIKMIHSSRPNKQCLSVSISFGCDIIGRKIYKQNNYTYLKRKRKANKICLFLSEIRQTTDDDKINETKIIIIVPKKGSVYEAVKKRKKNIPFVRTRRNRIILNTPGLSFA